MKTTTAGASNSLNFLHYGFGINAGSFLTPGGTGIGIPAKAYAEYSSGGH